MGRMSQFVHLHAHSHYSLLDGLSKPADMVAHVKAQGAPALALTDHGVLYGAIDFYETAVAAGIKPIIGLEAYMAPGSRLGKTQADANPYHLILLAKNKTGYQNLLKLVTEAHLTGYYYKPRIDWELLAEHHEGLICTSACLASETSQLILKGNYEGAKEVARKYAGLFGPDHYYLELQHHPNIPEQGKVNEAIKRIAAELELPLVATNDSHYVKPEDAEAQDVLLCVQTGKLLDDTQRLNMTDEDFSLKTPAQMAEPFRDTPEAIENTVKIAGMCDLKLELGGMILPKFELPEKVGSERQYFRRLVYEGMLERYRTDQEQPAAEPNLAPLASGESAAATKLLKSHGLSDSMLERVEYEMGVIERMGYESYFLIVADFVNWAKAQEIVVGPGRGSGAGSIIAYALKITNLDPLAFGLLFERFLNPDRISMPDFDIDFADDRRGEVIEYVAHKYGADHVAQVITFGTLGAKAAVRDTGRVMGMSYDTVDAVCKLVPGRPGTKLADARRQSDITGLERDDAQIKRLLDLAEKLEGSNRHASTHAAGVVIGDKPLVNYVPLQHATRGDTSIVTQYSMFPIEKIGLLKMDFLGLANLTIMRNATEIIEAVHGVAIDVDSLPLDDGPTYELLARAQTHGVFQLESDGMRRYIRELKPNRFEDIVAMVSLYRPGPMQFIDSFIKRKHGQEQIKYAHPDLKNALEETYGVLVYQEQIMQVSKDLAGFSGGEADTLRKAVGKKIRSLMDKMRPQFVAGMVSNGYSEALGKELFDLFEAFAQYGFNKAHAACYALIAYQTAYLKAHYPSPFMAALMTAEQENLDKLAVAITECEQMGLKVLPPDVNESFAGFAVAADKQSIRFGLSAIKNLGRNTVEAIIATRKADGPFTSLTNFLGRLPGGTANKKSLEALVKAGALDSLAEQAEESARTGGGRVDGQAAGGATAPAGDGRARMLAGLEMMCRFAAMRAGEQAAGQSSLFGAETAMQTDLSLPPAGTVDQRQKLEWERELLGMYVSEHPLSAYEPLMKNYPKLAELANQPDGKNVTVAGLVGTVKRISTRKGDPMAFVTIEDRFSKLEVIVFPNLYAEQTDQLAPGNLLKVSGKLSRKDGEVKLLANKLAPLLGSPVPSAAERDGFAVTDLDDALGGLGGSAEEMSFIPDAKETDAPVKVSVSAQPGAENNPSSDTTAPEEAPGQGVPAPGDIPESLTIELSPSTTLATLQAVKEVLIEHRGESPAYLVVPQNGEPKRLKLPQGIRHSAALVEALRQADRHVDVVVR